MMRSVLALLWALSFCCVTGLQAESPLEPAHDLVKDVVYNELQERRSVSLWQYRVEKTVVNQTVVQQQVETRSGPVYRVLERQGRPLDEAGRKKETDRLNSLLRSPGDQARMKQDYDAEEQRVQRLIAAMPDAFLYAYDGMAEGNAKLSFRPNPAYNPQTYEARVFHALAGEIWIQPQQKRLVKIDGHIDSQIDFGWGFLGRIEKGGTFQIGREPVSPNRWKTNMLNVHVSGHIVFFKTISKDQREIRSAYQPVPPDCSVEDAIKILDASLAP